MWHGWLGFGFVGPLCGELTVRDPGEIDAIGGFAYDDLPQPLSNFRTSLMLASAPGLVRRVEL